MLDLPDDTYSHDGVRAKHFRCALPWCTPCTSGHVGSLCPVTGNFGHWAETMSARPITDLWDDSFRLCEKSSSSTTFYPIAYGNLLTQVLKISFVYTSVRSGYTYRTLGSVKFSSLVQPSSDSIRTRWCLRPVD